MPVLSDDAWTAILLGASGGFGLGLGFVLAAAIARALRRYMEPDRRHERPDDDA